jgi:3',5'-cyclic AMP phosphodiesterase CpdA
LANKRFLGWLSWRVNRRHHYKRAVLDALIEDLRAQATDHIVLTGDLTNIGLEEEFVIASRVLRKLGSPQDVSLIPGNHDCYVALPISRSYARWSDYLTSDQDVTSDPLRSCEKTGTERSSMFAYRDAGPSLRIRGNLAVVGVCSAIPTPPLWANGAVGPEQLERLEGMLGELAKRGLCRVVLVHHPVLPENDSVRRGLADADAFRAVLQRAGAELVLHGHNHKTILGSLPGQAGEIPVVGVRSASYSGGDSHKAARYHVYEIEEAPVDSRTARANGSSSRWRIAMRARGWDAEKGEFADLGPARPITAS